LRRKNHKEDQEASQHLKSAVFQNNKNLDGYIASGGLPSDFETARKVHKGPSDVKDTVLLPTEHKDPGLVPG
jgi:hypothetical protein